MSKYLDDIKEILGSDADSLLNYTCWGIPTEMLTPPSPDFVDHLAANTNRPIPVLRSLQTLFDTGRLKGTGYLSILPVDQGVEHSAGASFALNPIYFDPEHIVRLALEAECSAVVSTLGVLGSVARKYAHRIPFILKINHNELLSYPNTYDQILFASVKQAQDMGAVAIGATIYFGIPESRRQIQEVSTAFHIAHEMGMATILWCYLRNKAFKTKENDYHLAADLTGQANYLGATIEADIVKQKLPCINGGFRDLHFGKTSPEVYDKLVPNNPIDLLRYQVANCYMGRVGLISSGGASVGSNDLKEAVKTAVINKRGGGMGLILGRKAFQRPFREGIHIIQNVQNVYLEKEITLA